MNLKPFVWRDERWRRVRDCTTAAFRHRTSTITSACRSRWRMARFHVAQHLIERDVGKIVRSAEDHERNGTTPGSLHFRLLADRANKLCDNFAQRWGVNPELVAAGLPGLEKLRQLAVPQSKRSRLWLLPAAVIGFGLTAAIAGMGGGVASVVFHLIAGGGR